MKIVQVMPEFGLAGAETMCENLTYELVKLGHQVTIISLYDFHSPITDRLENSGIRIIYLNKKPGLDFSMIFKLLKVFKEENTDVIHTHRYVMQYAIPAAVLAGVRRRVHTVHNVAKQENSYLARKLNYLFYKINRVVPVALSNLIKKTIIIEYGLKPESIPVILNGIDLSKCIVKKDYDIDNCFKVLHIGRFSEQKNHNMLIKAFGEFCKKAPNSVLQLIGDGEKKEEIKQLVANLGISDKVEFLGLKENVYKYLNTADVFVLPSLYEGMPMTLIEAMGTGLPIIATNVGGIPDMLVSGVEALIIDLDVNELSSTMMRVYKEKQTRESLGKMAYERSKNFSSSTMANQYIEVYLK